jgi:glycosyltransferase involved in cell wall biosynthesis
MSDSIEKAKIAIVAHFAYGALAGGSTGHIGGVERQTSLLARWLAARGHDVTLIVWDEGQPSGQVIDGVRVVKICRESAGFPGLRFLHPRWTSLTRALREADADVYYQNCGEYVTGQVALWCRRHARAFVYASASDADCDGSLPLMPELRVRLLYRTGVRLADRIIVQTAHQQRMIAAGFQRDSSVVPMPCPAPTPAARVPRASRHTVIWVGRICEVKRPDRFVDVAKACPELDFLMIGPNDDSPEYVRRIAGMTAEVANLTLHGPATRAQLEDLYHRALCLCCTSDHEGFPNTFLEAWSHGLPLVSTWDPDGVIAASRLGIVARGTDEIASGLRELRDSASVWERISANASRYFNETHVLDVVMPEFERMLVEAARGRRTAAIPRMTTPRLVS